MGTAGDTSGCSGRRGGDGYCGGRWHSEEARKGGIGGGTASAGWVGALTMGGGWAAAAAAAAALSRVSEGCVGAGRGGGCTARPTAVGGGGDDKHARGADGCTSGGAGETMWGGMGGGALFDPPSCRT